ncbi:hypothetical protein ACFLQV_04335, partial [Calditrichota bacterium]
MFLKLIRIVLLVFILVSISNAQIEVEWSNSFGDTLVSKFTSLFQTSDSGFVLAGSQYISSIDRSDYLLIKVDQNGREDWSYHYGGNSSKSCYSAIQTSDGGYFLGGTTFYGSASSIYVVRTDSEGELIWYKRFGYALDYDIYKTCYSVAENSDGGFALAGTYQAADEDTPGLALYILDSDGDMLWYKSYRTGEIDHCTSIMPTQDGGYAIAGDVRTISNRNL